MYKYYMTTYEFNTKTYTLGTKFIICFVHFSKIRQCVITWSLQAASRIAQLRKCAGDGITSINSQHSLFQQ